MAGSYQPSPMAMHVYTIGKWSYGKLLQLKVLVGKSSKINGGRFFQQAMQPWHRTKYTTCVFERVSKSKLRSLCREHPLVNQPYKIPGTSCNPLQCKVISSNKQKKVVKSESPWKTTIKVDHPLENPWGFPSFFFVNFSSQFSSAAVEKPPPGESILRFLDVRLEPFGVHGKSSVKMVDFHRKMLVNHRKTIRKWWFNHYKWWVFIFCYNGLTMVNFMGWYGIYPSGKLT